MADIELIKARLKGNNLNRLLKEKKVSKYKLSKDCNITYRTLLYWQKGNTTPSDELAKRVAEYLGMMKPRDGEIKELREQIKTLEGKLDRLSKGKGKEK